MTHGRNLSTFSEIIRENLNHFIIDNMKSFLNLDDVVSPYELCHEKKLLFAYAKIKGQISCVVNVQLISAFVFAT